MDSEHDSKVAGHFRREGAMELLTLKFYWPNMEGNGCSIATNAMTFNE
jgi:hypothetical protein